jgi:hypothetical protein
VGTDYCLFFYDVDSGTFINVWENDKSVLISKTTSKFKKRYIELKLFNTKKYAPGPMPYKYGGSTGKRLVTNATGANILCYKWLNLYQFKTETWVNAQTYRLRHHKGCNFDLPVVDGTESKAHKGPGLGADWNDTEPERPVAKPKPKPVAPKPKGPQKGDLAPDWGLYIERPFYVVSELNSHRYLDLVGNNLVIKTPNGFGTQVFYFDWKTKTIMTKSRAGYSWQIENAGKSANMHVS